MSYDKPMNNNFIIETKPEKVWKIKLEYFDYKGNYFGEGEFLTKKTFMFEIYDEVMFLKDNNALPNLKGDKELIIYIDGSNHPNGFPVLCCLDDRSNNSSTNSIISTNLEKQEEKYKIKIEYFKNTGKYYTEDVLLTEESTSNKILEEVCRLRSINELPGVVNSDEFIVYINTSDYIGGFKKILF